MFNFFCKIQGLLQNDDERSRMYKYMLALWEEVFLPPKINK